MASLRTLKCKALSCSGAVKSAEFLWSPVAWDYLVFWCASARKSHRHSLFIGELHHVVLGNGETTALWLIPNIFTCSIAAQYTRKVAEL